MTRLIVSIDVGLLNLGLLVAEVAEDYMLDRIIAAHKIDLRQLAHTTVARKNCLLHHANCTADRVMHVIQEHRAYFDRAEKVLIERQPLCGLTDVEQVFMALLRDKTVLVSPNAMHKHFDIGHLNYDGRKVATTRLANQHLEHDPVWKTLTRKHDVADAYCLMMFWLSRQQHTHHKTQLDNRLAEVKLNRQRHTGFANLDKSGTNVLAYLESFRFAGCKGDAGARFADSSVDRRYAPGNPAAIPNAAVS